MDKSKVKIWRDALNSMKGNLLTKHAEHKLGKGQPEGEGGSDGYESPHQEEHDAMHADRSPPMKHNLEGNEGQGAADSGELPTEGEGDNSPVGEVEEPEGSFHEGPGNAPELDVKSRSVAHMKASRKKGDK